MNIYYLANKKLYQYDRPEIHKTIAFHAAGQAAAICLRNKRLGLPSLYFRLLIKSPRRQACNGGQKTGDYAIKIDGGRLIETLPSSLPEATKGFSDAQKSYYEKAFAADIVNILAGSVAEAKYVAQRDGEIITPSLVNFNSLGFYNGTADMEDVLSYIKCMNVALEDRQKKMINLYLASFTFVSEPKTWDAIARLAYHILTVERDIIGGDEVTSVLEKHKAENLVINV